MTKTQLMMLAKYAAFNLPRASVNLLQSHGAAPFVAPQLGHQGPSLIGNPTAGQQPFGIKPVTPKASPVQVPPVNRQQVLA